MERTKMPGIVLLCMFRCGNVLLGDFRELPRANSIVLLLSIGIHHNYAIDIIECGKRPWCSFTQFASVYEDGVVFNSNIYNYNPENPPPSTPSPEIVAALEGLAKWDFSPHRMFILPVPSELVETKWIALPKLSFPSADFINIIEIDPDRPKVRPRRIQCSPPAAERERILFDPRNHKTATRNYMEDIAAKNGMMVFSRAAGGIVDDKRKPNIIFIAYLPGVTKAFVNPRTEKFNNFIANKKHPLLDRRLGDFAQVTSTPEGHFEHMNTTLDEKMFWEVPTKPFMDIEGKFAVCPSLAENRDAITILATNVMIAHLKTYFPSFAVLKREILTLSNDTNEKISRHVILPMHMIASHFLLKHIMRRLYEKLCFCHDAPSMCTAPFCSEGKHAGPQLYLSTDDKGKQFVIDFGVYSNRSLRPGGCAKITEKFGETPRIIRPAGMNEFPSVSTDVLTFHASLVQYPYGGVYNEERIYDIPICPGDTIFGEPVEVDIFGKLVENVQITYRPLHAPGSKGAVVRNVMPLLAKMSTCAWASHWEFHPYGGIEGANVRLFIKNAHGRFCSVANTIHGGATINLMFFRMHWGTYKVYLFCFKCFKSVVIVEDLGDDWKDVLTF